MDGSLVSAVDGVLYKLGRGHRAVDEQRAHFPGLGAPGIDQHAGAPEEMAARSVGVFSTVWWCVGSRGHLGALYRQG